MVGNRKCLARSAGVLAPLGRASADAAVFLRPIAAQPPGKMKQEKRLKQWHEEQRRLSMKEVC